MDISGKASVFDLTEIPNTNWYFGIVVDEAVAYQSVSRMVTSALIQGLLTILIVAGFSYVAINGSLAPLKTLGEAIANLSRGNGDLTRRIKIEREDEVGTVAKHVNTFIERIHVMVQDISNSSTQLNQQARSSHDMAEKSDQGLARQQNEISRLRPQCTRCPPPPSKWPATPSRPRKRPAAPPAVASTASR